MAQFEVLGTNKSGKKTKVIVEAEHAKAARIKARGLGLIPISATISDASATEKESQKTLKGQLTSGMRGVKFQEISDMTRQLSSLVKAHVPVVESLSALVEQVDSVRLKNILIQVRQHVREGKSLGDAFELFPKLFNRVYVNMVRAGESSGRLDIVLIRLADFQEGQVKLRSKVMGALLYPIIMVIVSFLVIGIIFVKVVPQITRVFLDMKASLPLSTQILIVCSDFVQSYYVIILGAILGLSIFLRLHFSTDAGRTQKDYYSLKAPVLGKLVRNIAVSRFSRTLGTLLQSGVPMLGALQITRNVVANVNFEKAIESASLQVSEGRSLAASLKQSKEFPPIVIHMVSVGEKTGELEQMLVNLAENYENQVDSSLQNLTGLLGPIMIVVLAGLVGFIVMATLVPIFQMNQFG